MDSRVKAVIYDAAMNDLSLLPDGWIGLSSSAESAQFERELARELPTGHALKGVTLQAVARNGLSDDVLFRLNDGSYAEVHLTWSVETDPHFPAIELFNTIEQWRTKRDSADNRETR